MSGCLIVTDAALWSSYLLGADQRGAYLLRVGEGGEARMRDNLYSRKDLHPLVTDRMDAEELVPGAEFMLACGCYKVDDEDTWAICQFHNGMQWGIRELRNVMSMVADGMPSISASIEDENGRTLASVAMPDSCRRSAVIDMINWGADS